MTKPRIASLTSLALISAAAFSCIALWGASEVRGEAQGATAAPPPPPPKDRSAGLSESEILELGTEAYIYGYPLVTMEMTRRVMTNVAEPQGTRAPMGQFVRMREYPSASFRDVTAPNADTLYTTAWVDLSKEPWVLELPDFGDRYFLFPMLDGWTNVFEVPGKRTTGGKAARYAITGPGWRGTLPEGVVQYKSPTDLVWILGRIYCDGTPADYAAVHALQDAVRLAPLGSFGQTFSPPKGTVDPSLDMKTAVREQVNRLDATAYFDLLAKLMVDNPPSVADAPMVAKLARLGIVPGQRFSSERLGPDAAGPLAKVPAAGVARIMGDFQRAGATENGWVFTTKTGVYGTDYLTRALITAIGLGANRPQDAVYPTSEKDAAGKPYDGANSYTMHFAKDQLPPVRGFWSLTMYDADYFFVANPLNRYTLSSRNRFDVNPDGSIALLIQHADPGPGKQANWLPAPKGRFILMLRLYWPQETPPSILNGSWKIPAVVEAR